MDEKGTILMDKLRKKDKTINGIMVCKGLDRRVTEEHRMNRMISNYHRRVANAKGSNNKEEVINNVLKSACNQTFLSKLRI